MTDFLIIGSRVRPYAPMCAKLMKSENHWCESVLKTILVASFLLEKDKLFVVLYRVFILLFPLQKFIETTRVPF